MIVVSMTNCPPKLRGDLSKWLLEINTGVYVGQVSSRVREALWKRICENIRNGQATMVFTANNEQHMDFYVHNTSWEPVDFNGIKLMKHPSPSAFNAYNVKSDIKPGFSNAAKRRMGAKNRKSISDNSYFLLDIETTGLSYEKDKIIEIGLIRVRNNNIVNKYDWLIHSEESIPDNIKKLTGIDEILLKNGYELKDVLNELFMLIKGQTVLIYNAEFDLNFLKENAIRLNMDFPDIKSVDVIIAARKCIKGLDNYKLDTIASHFGIKNNQRHRAIEDCKLLYEIYNKLNEFSLPL